MFLTVKSGESTRTPMFLNVKSDGCPKSAFSPGAVKFSPDGKQILITTDKVVRLYDTETWRCRDLNLNSLHLLNHRQFWLSRGQ